VQQSRRDSNNNRHHALRLTGVADIVAGSARQFSTVFIFTVSVLFYPRPAFTENHECSPDVYPVKNFAGHVGTVQDNARNLANFMLNLLRNLPTAPPLYSDKPVAEFLQQVVNNSTVFNWDDTASVLRDVERDLRNQRMRVLQINSSAVAAMRGTIADAGKAPDVYATALGMLTPLKTWSDEIRDKYFKRAFSHLSSCLASCAGPKGYDLGAFRVSFADLYGNATSKTFVTTTQALGDARISMENLPHALQALISETPTDSFNTTVLGALEAAKLKNAADQLADAQRGNWLRPVGERNQNIRQAIGMLRVGWGERVDGRPHPQVLITTSLDLATKAQSSIDDFVQVHSKLLHDLQAFLDQYKRSYQPGCRPNDIAAGSSISLRTQ
jgi:hypothetical protein